MENLFDSWNEFKKGKKKRKDIQSFERHVEDRIFQLHEKLKAKRYQHSPYTQFYVFEPKKRYISKATVEDRLVHHLIYKTLTPIYEKIFLPQSVAGRIGKGIHFGLNLLKKMTQKVSKNNTRHCFALKMDIKRFFDSVHHEILKDLLRKRVTSTSLLQLIDQVIDSFRVDSAKDERVVLQEIKKCKNSLRI